MQAGTSLSSLIISHTVSPYAYCAGNPINNVDVKGRDVVFISYSGYEIALGKLRVPGLGHAAVLLINNKTGITKYYEYGRYDSEKKGITRKISVPNVRIGEDGRPTEESLQIVYSYLSRTVGKNHPVKGAYIESDEYDKMDAYARDIINENDNPNRQRYSLLNHNCATFAIDVISQDETVKEKLPLITAPVPSLLVNQLQARFSDEYHTQTPQ